MQSLGRPRLRLTAISSAVVRSNGRACRTLSRGPEWNPTPAHAAVDRLSLAPTTWTPEAVKARFIAAADTLRRLRQDGVRRRVTYWPDMVREFNTDYGWGSASAPDDPPGGEEIDRMDEVLGWCMWIEPGAAQLVWARAADKPWWWISRKLGRWGFPRGERQLQRLHADAIDVIVRRLNTGDVPEQRSGRDCRVRPE